MTDREKVIKGLECCIDDAARGDKCWENGDYVECPYNDNVDGCMIRLEIDAIELLKAQEPRVLSREEIINANGYIWKEYSSMWAMTAVLIEYGMERIPYKGDYSTLELDWRSYGVTWRCWNVCPTEEQREATPWES